MVTVQGYCHAYVVFQGGAPSLGDALKGKAKALVPIGREKKNMVDPY